MYLIISYHIHQGSRWCLGTIIFGAHRQIQHRACHRQTQLLRGILLPWAKRARHWSTDIIGKRCQGQQKVIRTATKTGVTQLNYFNALFTFLISTLQFKQNLIPSLIDVHHKILHYATSISGSYIGVALFMLNPGGQKWHCRRFQPRHNVQQDELDGPQPVRQWRGGWHFHGSLNARSAHRAGDLG